MIDINVKFEVLENFIHGKSLLEIMKKNNLLKDNVLKVLEEYGYNERTKNKIEKCLLYFNQFDYLSVLTKKSLELENCKLIKILQILSLIKLKEYKEAYRMLLNNSVNQDFYFVLLKIKVLEKSRELSRALHFCNQVEYQDIDCIVAKKLSILIQERQFMRALNICNQIKYKNSPRIQSSKIKILFQLNRIDEAMMICNNPIFADNGVITAQKIELLMAQVPVDKKAILELCESPKFINDESVQKRKIDFLCSLGQLEEALQICLREEFRYSERMQKVKVMIENLIKFNSEGHKSMKEVTTSINNNEDLAEAQNVFEKVKNRTILINDIEESSLSDWKKLILKCLYYEKNNKKIGLDFLKKVLISNKYTDNDFATLKAIKVMLENQKRGIISYDFYSNKLGLNDGYKRNLSM